LSSEVLVAPSSYPQRWRYIFILWRNLLRMLKSFLKSRNRKRKGKRQKKKKSQEWWPLSAIPAT
jgi:hypothetical protein